jgi:hypothetical protein
MAYITAIAYDRGSGRVLHAHHIFSEKELSDSERGKYEKIVRKDAAAITGADESTIRIRLGKHDEGHTALPAAIESRAQGSTTFDRSARKPLSVASFHRVRDAIDR